MCEYLELLALLSQSKHPLRAKVIDVECILERVIKVDRCRTIDKYVRFIDDQLVVLRRNAQAFHDQVTLDRNDLRPGKLLELLLPHRLDHSVEALRREDLLLNSAHWRDLSLWPHHDIDLANIGTSSK